MSKHPVVHDLKVLLQTLIVGAAVWLPLSGLAYPLSEALMIMLLFVGLPMILFIAYCRMY